MLFTDSRERRINLLLAQLEEVRTMLPRIERSLNLEMIRECRALEGELTTELRSLNAKFEDNDFEPHEDQPAFQFPRIAAG